MVSLSGRPDAVVYIGIPTWPKVLVLKSWCLDVRLKFSTKAEEDRYVGVSIELEVL